MRQRKYSVRFMSNAEKAFDKLDKGDKRLVVAQLEKLERAPELGKPLADGLAGFRKMYCARKRLRIIYRIENDQLVVLVIAIGERDKGFRQTFRRHNSRPRASR